METNNTEAIQSEEPVINDPKAVLDALDRAKSDAKKFREEKEQLETDLNSKDEKIAKISNRLLNEKIVQRLSAEGLKEPDRFVKYLDTTKLEFDENLDINGLDEQLEGLRNDFPEIFDPKVRVGGQADAAIKASVSTKYTATEMQAAQILGKKI